MAAGGTRTVKIRFDGDSNPLAKASRQGEKAIGGLQSRLSKFRDSALASFTGNLAADFFSRGLSAAKDFLTESVKGWEEHQKVVKNTANAIKVTGGAANVTVGQVSRLADSIERNTGVDGDLIQQGSNLLLTFKNVANQTGKNNDVFNRATKAAVDLSAAGFGSVDGASKQLGKALNDPVKGIAALSKAGVTFTAAQKKEIAALQEKGDLLGAQKIILKEVEGQVGGSAAAQVSATDKVMIVVRQLQDTIGKALMPVITRLADFAIKRLVPAIQKFFEAARKSEALARIKKFIQDAIPVLQNFARQFLEVAQAVLPKLKAAVQTAFSGLVSLIKWVSANREWIEPIASGILAIVVALKAYQGAVALIQIATKAWAVVQGILNLVMAANPIGLIVLAIVGLVAAIVIAWKRSDTFRKIVTGAFNAVWGVVKAVGAWFKNTLWPWIRGVFDGIQRVIGAVWGWIKKNWPLLLGILTGPIGLAVVLIAKNWNKIKAGATAVKNWIVSRLTEMANFVRSIPGRIANAGRTLFDVYKRAATAWVRFVLDKATSLVNAIKGLPRRISSAASGMFNGIKSAFRSAINWVIGKWNNLSLTLGGGQIKLPGGKSLGIPSLTLNTPNIGYLAKGGPAIAGRSYVVGENGPELLTMGRHSGTVIPNDQPGNGGGMFEGNLYLDSGEFLGMVRGEIRESNRRLKSQLRAGAGAR